MILNTTLLKRISTHLKWELPKASVGSGLACAAFLMLAIYVWILPIGHTTALRNLMFFSLIFLTIWAVWKYELKPRFPVAWAWGLYAAVAVFSLFYAIDPGYSLSEIKTELIYGILAFILGATWIRNEISLNRLMVLLLLGNAFLVGYAIFQGAVIFRDMPPIPRGSLNSGFGTFSTYLVTVIPFVVAYTALHFRNHPFRWFLAILLIANLVALYYTISRAAVLALMIEIAIAAVVVAAYYASRLSQRRQLMLGGLLVLAILSLATLFNIQMARRTPAHLQNVPAAEAHQDVRITLLWPAAIENIRTSPWSGGGFGRNAYKLRNPDVAKASPAFWHAHNVLLNKGVQMGLPGIIAFILLLATLAWTIKPTRQLMINQPALAIYSGAGIAMIGGIITKNFTDDYFIRDNALMFWLLTGALAGAISNWKETRKNRSISSDA